MTAPRIVTVRQNILKANDYTAAENRRTFAAASVRAINLASSPGAGKTALLERTLRDLAGTVRMAVAVGDLATDNDAARLRQWGAQAEQIVTGLEKVYAGKGVLCEFEIAAQARFHGETGDLQELLGNLLENAFKWAKSRVLLTVAVGECPVGKRPGLTITVEDDGPGIADDRIAHVLQRGVRGDERVQGHGIGLAIVQDIIRAYRGELRVGRSEERGGARFEVELPGGP